MTIRHHISDDLLMAYAAGALPEAFALVLATHVSMCDDCRAALAGFEAVGGAMLDASDQIEMDEGSLDRVFSRLDAPEKARPTRPAGILPLPLQDYIGGDLSAVKWRSLGMGVRQAILPTEGVGSARLLYIPAGQSVPDHGHRGLELTLVLQGAFRDKTDRFGPGDMEIATEALQHTPVAEAGPACICLAATDAKLRFNGLIPRLAQQFMGI